MEQTMPSRFPLYDKDDAPEKSRSYLEQVEAAFGMIPNLERVMAGAPALLAAYVTAWDRFDETTLTPAERQIVYQTANFENNCEYCMPWHTVLAEKSGLAPADVEALRHAAPLSNPKQEALRVFTRDLLRTRGSVEPAALRAFLNAGYGEVQALEVVLGLGVKLMSNYTNAIAQTPLDRAAQHKAWKKPSLRG